MGRKAGHDVTQFPRSEDGYDGFIWPHPDGLRRLHLVAVGGGCDGLKMAPPVAGGRGDSWVVSRLGSDHPQSRSASASSELAWARSGRAVKASPSSSKSWAIVSAIIRCRQPGATGPHP